MKYKIKEIYISLIIVIINFYFVFRGLFGKRLAYGDFTPFSDSYQSSFNHFLYMWTDKGIGESNIPNLYYLIRSFFEFIFRTPEIAQGMFIFTFLFLSFYGINILLKIFKINLAIRLFAGFFYINNPIIFGEISNGALGILILYAMIPYLFYNTLLFIKKGNILNGFLVSIIVSIMILNLQTFFWIGIWIIPLLLVYIFINKRYFKNIFMYCIFGILGILLNSSVFLAFFSNQANFKNISYLSTFRHTYKEATINNIFLTAANNGSSQAFLGYFNNENGLFSLLMSIFIIIIIIGFLYKNKSYKENKVIYLLFLSIFLFIVGFINGIRTGFFEQLILEKNIIFVSLRNPQKLLYFYIFLYSILIGFSLHNIFNKLNKGYIKNILLLFLIIIAVGFNKNYFDGTLGLKEIRNGKYYIENKYNDLSKFILENKEGKYIYLPFDYSLQLKTFWNKEIISIKMGGSMNSDYSNSIIFQNIYSNTCNGIIDLNLYRKLGIKYIIVDNNPESYKDMNYTKKYKDMNCINLSFYGTPYIWGKSSYFNNLLKSYKIHNISDFNIYELPINISEIIEANNGNIDNKRISNVQYDLALYENLKEKRLYFYNSYNPNWKIYLKNQQGLFTKPLFENTHKKIYDYANGWTISKDEIISYVNKYYSDELKKEGYPKKLKNGQIDYKYYKLNPDGSIDVELTLYFKPQLYFYIGLIISGTTFAFLILWLIITSIRERRKKKLITN